MVATAPKASYQETEFGYGQLFGILLRRLALDCRCPQPDCSRSRLLSAAGGNPPTSAPCS